MNGPHMQFFGNLTQDPEQRYTNNEGIPYTRLRVAVNTYRHEQPTETIYVDVDLWRFQADRAMQSLHQGPAGLRHGPVFLRDLPAARRLPRSRPPCEREGIPGDPPGPLPRPGPTDRSPDLGRTPRLSRGLRGTPDTMDDIIDVPPAQAAQA